MTEIPLANWNGDELPLDQVRVSVLDRAFLFGDAVYEALRVYRGKVWLLTEHLDRLRRSLGELRIECDVDRLEQRLLATVKHSGVAEGLVYLQVTRGEAPRTHKFPANATPNELIYVANLGGDPYANQRETGIAVITHPDTRWARRDIKSVNLLGNCLASQAAAEAGCVEAILVEPGGMISEGSHTTVFAVKDGQLWTAPNSHHILPGITRGLVFSLAETAEIPLHERAFQQKDLDEIDELFLTGTTVEVLAIVQVDGRPIGTAAPGAITQRLSQAYQDAIENWLGQEAPV